MAFVSAQAAYLTDHSEIPEASFDKLQGLDILFLDALRHKPHPTHSTVENSLTDCETRETEAGVFHSHLPRLAARSDQCDSATECAAVLRRDETGVRDLMQVFHKLADIPADFGPTVVSVGNFDGVHRAHAAVLKEIVDRARAAECKSVAVSFEPHPVRILRPDSGLKLLTRYSGKTAPP